MNTVSVVLTRDEVEVIMFLIENRHMIPNWMEFTVDKETYIGQKLLQARADLEKL